MKVLYLVSGVGPPAGWGTEFIQNLIFKLSEKDIEAVILTPIYQHTHPGWQNWISEIEKRYKIKIYAFSLPSFIQKNLNLYLILIPIVTTFYAFKILTNKHFDIIHEFSSTPIILFRSLLFKILFKIPIIYTHSVFNNTFLGKLFWFKFFDFANYYLIPSKGIITRLKQIGVNPKKIIYSPPGIDFLKQNQINKAESRRILGLPKDKIVFSYFGPLTKEKGVVDLIEAAKILSQKTKEKILISLFVIWKGSPEHQKIKNYILSLQMKHTLLKEKYVDIATLLAASDFVILPQQTGQGTTIPPIGLLEALVAHRPTIATSIIGNNEIIDSNTGIIVEPYSPRAISEAIEYIMKLRFNKRSFNHIVKQFKMNLSVTLHLNIYRQALGANKNLS